MSFKIGQSEVRFSEYLKVQLLSFIGQIIFVITSYCTAWRNYNEEVLTEDNYIFALWHSQQIGIYSIPNREKLVTLISQSVDGEIIMRSAGRVGIRAIRGSAGRGGTRASLELITEVKNGNSIAIMIDGPKGPKHVVKKGVISIAKNTGIKIMPMAWTMKPKFRIPTWDRLYLPTIFGNSTAIYGEAFEVPADADDDKIEELRLKLENELIKLNEDLNKNFDEYVKKAKKNKEKTKSVVKWF